MKKILLVIVAFTCIQAAAKPVPREKMPLRVYEGLKNSIASFHGDDRAERECLRNLGGLKVVKDFVRFPKYDELEYLCMRLRRDSSVKFFCWGSRSERGELQLVMDDFTDVSFSADLFSEVRKESFINVVDGSRNDLLQLLVDISDGESDMDEQRWKRKIPLVNAGNEWVFWKQLGVPDPRIQDVLFQFAYICLYNNDARMGKTFVDLLLYLEPAFFCDLRNDLALQAINGGTVLLSNNRSFRDVYEYLLTIKKIFDETKWSLHLNSLLKNMKPQVLAEIDPTAVPTETPASTPSGRRIQSLVKRLPETCGIVSGAFWNSTYNPIYNELFEIGEPAIDALIERVDDRRLTKVISHSRPNSVLRVGNVATRCIQRILAGGPTFRYEGYSWKNKDDLRHWWEKNKNKKFERQNTSGLYADSLLKRMDTLRILEHSFPDKIDSVDLLQQWAAAYVDEATPRSEAEWKMHDSMMGDREWPYQSWCVARGKELGRIAAKMAKLGDFSIRPTMREGLQFCLNRKEDATPYYVYLVEHGEDEDFATMFRQMEKEAKETPYKNALSKSTRFMGMISWSTHPLTVPMLVVFLDMRDEYKLKKKSPYENGVSCFADRAMQTLIERTGVNKGYKTSYPILMRKKAFDRWKEWWEESGKKEYFESHQRFKYLIGDSVR